MKANTRSNQDSPSRMSAKTFVNLMQLGTKKYNKTSDNRSYFHKIFYMFYYVLFIFGIVNAQTYAATAEDLNNEAALSLKKLTQTNEVAKSIAEKAKAVLVFPKIVRAGLIFGGSYGEGVLLKHSRPINYYNSVSASWGLQAGAQSYGYIVFLMKDKIIEYLNNSHGWEIGIGPSVVVVNEGIAKNLSTTTLQEDAYAFTFDQHGLMASFSLEGTKISPIKR